MRLTLTTMLLAGTLVAGTMLAGCEPPAPTGIARIGEKTITQAQFDAFLRLKGMPTDDSAIVERARSEYLERERLAAAIEARGLLEPELVAAEVNEFRKQMLISRYIEQYLNDQVSDTALRNYYASHQADYQSEQVRVAHILLRTNPQTTAEEAQALLTRMHEIHSKLGAGESFEALARAHSEDRRSAGKGGDLGWIKRGAIAPEFNREVFALAAGDVSEPFRTSFGFHIVKVLEGPEVITTPFESVRGDIRYQLRNQAKQAELARLVESVELEVSGS